jgi:hypothetical protein
MFRSLAKRSASRAVLGVVGLMLLGAAACSADTITGPAAPVRRVLVADSPNTPPPPPPSNPIDPEWVH